MRNYWKIKPIKVHFGLDTDRDRITDWKDCKPFNPKRQDKKFTTKDINYFSNAVYKFTLNDDWAFYTISSFFRAPDRYKEKSFIKEVVTTIHIDYLHKIPPQSITNAVNELYKYFSKRYPKLTYKDDLNLKLANDIIEGRQSYGLREELADKKAIKIFWSNGSAQWHMDRTFKPGDIVSLDANEVILPLTEQEFERIRLYLIALPLYIISLEAKQRGHAPEHANEIWALLQAERMNRERGV